MEFYLTQILFFGANFAPRSFMFCQGQIMSIAQHTALFSLLGTTYGGNGQTTFALPDARGRAFLGQGQGPGTSNYALGQMAGTETTTLILPNMPAHNHTLAPGGVTLNAMAGVSALEEVSEPEANAHLGTPHDTSGDSVVIYVPAGATGTTVPLGGVSLNGSTSIAGNNVPINNMQPYTVVNAIICVEGIFPSRN
ncbi:phage tail protein [Sphingosinithalassobacter sp. LHW66-3]|uniref:phage tail protein n=1 Tax=Sphingosinithalassobacter sp. LHW66-3 TaxID=3424718 RepID=UPI003D6BB51B